MTDFGRDITTWAWAGQTSPDLDPSFTEITGPESVGQSCARRLSMRHGALPDDPDAGFDLRQFVNRPFTKAVGYRIKTGIERECVKDERVYAAAAALTYTTTDRSLVAEIWLDTMYGQFPLVLAVSAVSVSILRAS